MTANDPIIELIKMCSLMACVKCGKVSGRISCDCWLLEIIQPKITPQEKRE